MEWVETTGRTVEEARQAALEQLGVAEEDAEVQVVEEPRPGLFGRMRGEARVRARVRPTPVRPKEDRRDRRRRRNGSGSRAAGGAGSGGSTKVAANDDDLDGDEAGTSVGDSSGADRGDGPGRSYEEREDGPRSGRGRRRGRGSGGGTSRDGNGSRAAGSSEFEDPEGSDQGEAQSVSEDVALEEQAAAAVSFLSGLVEALGVDAEVQSELIDEDTCEVRVTGADLGTLIGPRGDTLAAIQELARTVVQRQLGAHNGRLLVDIAGYRQKRRTALERFTREVADQVKSTGQRRVLEPMPPADRKIVHDTVNDIDGLTTTSEGEEPRRRVVIIPQG